MSPNDLAHLLDEALLQAQQQNLPLPEERSSAWVDALARGFQRWYADRPNVQVFWARCEEQTRSLFGRSEMLHDVLVSELSTTSSPGHGKQLSYPSRVLWQVESEFHESDTQKSMNDFAKLPLGSAERKLFIAPRRGNMDAFRKTFLPVARSCSREFFLAFVPHPSRWSVDSTIDVWTLDAERQQWLQVERSLPEAA